MPLIPEWIVMCTWVVLGVGLFVQVVFLLFEFTPVGFGKDTPSSGATPKVSVIICARNELKNLRSFLPSVLDQNYPEYQVVVVNDCSWDESGKYLEEMEDAYPHLKVVTLNEQEKYQHGKKFALTLGIKAAIHEHLIFTDADCKPASPNWVREMAGTFVEGKEIIVAYGAYFKEPGLLNKWIRFDTAMNALLYISRAKKGKAYMGVGRNMAYVKSLFFKNKGFANHYHLMSGDDDLFINETATSNNTAVCIHPDAVTFSKPKTSFSTWIWQKKRHMSTGTYYRSRDRLLIGWWFMSLFLYWVGLIAAFILKLNPQIVVSILAFRLVVQMIVYWKGFRKLGENDLVLLVPFFDFFSFLIYPLLAVSNLFVKTKSWK